jgi:hypothetical protein
MRVALSLLAVSITMAVSTSAILSGQTVRDPEKLLASARDQLQAMTRRLANYACIETVDRKYFQRSTEAPSGSAAPPVCAPPRGDVDPDTSVGGDTNHTGLRLESTDRLRLEVAFSQGVEIDSWPGATRFDARGVNELITGGLIGAGAFATYLLDVFDNPGVIFTYAGEGAGGSQAGLEYHYHVPVEASHYHVKIGASWQSTAYDGSFWLDPDSLELRRLTLRTGALPPATSMCEAEATLDYHRIHIGDGDVLLPRQASLRTLMLNTHVAENSIAFSACREYHAESQLLFDTGADGETASTKMTVRAPVALTIGLPITLALTAPIDTDTAAAGDLVSAKVVKAVRQPGSTSVLIPAGATVRGRIARVEHHLIPTPYFLIAISFSRLELTGSSSPFAARLDRDTELATRLGANLLGRRRGIDFWDVGNFLFPTSKTRYVLPAGYESRWYTLATPAR